MILLDTNVVSELICESPHPDVWEWSRTCPSSELFFSTVGEAELRYGATILPVGQRQEKLVLKIETFLCDAFEDRILAFDRTAASVYADIGAMRRLAGHPVAPLDCQIAAIAAANGMAVATRNTRDFSQMGIDVINPWDYGGAPSS